MPNMPKKDIAYEQTEELIQKLIRELNREYNKAAEQMKAEANDYFRRFEIKDKIWKQAVEDGTKTEEAYIAWRKQQILVGKRWNAMVEKLSQDAVKADMKAASTIKGYMPEAYAINHNYGTYLVESSGSITTSYTLYNAETVERLWRDDPQLLPDPAPESETARLLKENKDLRWNRAQIRSEITQAVIQGKDITEISNSLMTVMGKDKRTAITNARTMMTSAQNAGRNDGFIRAETMGIELTCEWLSTLDERTRTSHRLLNGQRKAVNEPFRVYDEIAGAMVEIYYPGDMGGKQYKVPADMLYNCRCAIVAWVKGFEPNDFVKSSPKMGDMTYEEWLQATPKPQKLTAPEEKAQAAKAAYIREYKEMAGMA